MQCARYISRSIIVVVLIGAEMLSACGRGGEDQALAQAKKPFGAGSPKMANAELEEAVREKLNTDDQLKTARLSVRADVTRNEVTLAGQLPSTTLKRKALDLAKTAHAGVIVIDKMIVTPSTSNGEARIK